MLITAIQIKRFENSESKMKAVASVNLDNMIVIHDIKVLASDEKIFLAMPSKQLKVGTFKDIVHPINAAVRGALETLIIGGYQIAEKEGYYRTDMTYTGGQKEDLTTQTMEDFTVQGVAGNDIPAFSHTVEAMVKSFDSKTSKSNGDEGLLKWLES